MSEIQTIPNVDAAWHAWRRQGVGGSDIATILGLSSYASPVSLYFSKVGLIDDNSPDTQRQRLGKRMEAVLAAEFNDMTGLYVVGEQTWCEHPERRWAHCTVDGLVTDNPIHGALSPEFEPIGVIEFKTDGRFAWPDGIPPNIRAQAIWQLGVTGMTHSWVVVLFAGFRIEIFEIDWDADAQADWVFMLDRATAFWVDNVQAGVVPPMDDHPATTTALTAIYDADPDGAVDIDDQGRTLVRQVVAAHNEAKAMQSTESRLKNELRAYMGDNTKLIDGWTTPGPRSKKGPQPIVAASWKAQDRRGFDVDAARQRYPRLIEKFTTTTTARVLRVPAQKEG